MALNILLTNLEPRYGQIIRSGIGAHVRTTQVQTTSVFRDPNLNKPLPPRQSPQQQIRKQPPPSHTGHTSIEFRFRNSQYQDSYQTQFNQNPNRLQFSNQESSGPTQFRSNNSRNQQRPPFNSQNKTRPPVIQRNPNYQPNHRIHHFNQSHFYE